MNSSAMPIIKRFPAAKQQRLDELLEKNPTGTLTPREKERLHALVDEAEALMVANAKLLSDFAKRQSSPPPSQAVPVTVWVSPDVSHPSRAEM